MKLPATIAAKLANVAGTRLGQAVSQDSNIIQVSIPSTMESKAPPLLARFQYRPKVIGANKETRLNIDDSPTNS